MTEVNDGHIFATPFNVVAGFRTRQQAESAARQLTSVGLPEGSVEVASADAGGPLETAELAAERDVLLAVHATEAETAERAARMLREELHAERVDLVDADGTPLPPQHDHPRPADPGEEYWWEQAGEG